MKPKNTQTLSEIKEKHFGKRGTKKRREQKSRLPGRRVCFFSCFFFLKKRKQVQGVVENIEKKARGLTAT